MNNEPIRIHQIVHRALARADVPAGLRRLVPVAWPIVEVEHTIKIRIEEELGVVERYVLEALARFGSMNAERLARFLGLETFVVEAVVENLQRFSGTISVVDGEHAAAPDTIERLGHEKWSRTLESAETFYIDGIGGRLLPISLSKTHRSKWLRVEPNGQSCRITDYAGNEIPNLCWLASAGCKGETALEEAIGGSDVERREELGIPAGAFGVVPGKSIVKHERWLLALLEVAEDGCVTVRPAFMPKWELAKIGAEHRGAFEESLRRGSEPASGMLNPNSDKRISSDVKTDWKPFIDFSANEGDFVVKLKDPSNLLFWGNEEESDDDESAPGKDAVGEQQTSMPASLRTVLRFPFWWHSYRFAVRRVVPGDRATAEAMLLLQGMDELRRVAGRAESEDVDLAVCWEEFQERASDDWPSELNDCRVSMKAMLGEAIRSPESQVVELVSEYL